MYVIRPIKKDDLANFEDVAFRVSMGILNLPKHPGKLNELLELSEASFSKDVTEPHHELYLFVLEDTETGTIGGTCGIFSKMSVKYPSFHYKIVLAHPHSEKVPVKKQMRLLQPVSQTDSPTEVGALYLLSEWRSYGLGRLLSLSRFLFIAAHSYRFTDEVVSHMRGHFDRSGVSPFWEGLGRNFLDLDFNEVLTILEKDKSFVADIMPEYPIYISLLSEEAQECIGKPHKFTKPAVNMLIQEGFQFSDEIDVFDGGPSLICNKDNIRIGRESQIKSVKEIHDQVKEGEEFLICNNKLDFRCCLGKIGFQSNENIILSREVADALKVTIGDTVRFSSPVPKKTNERKE